ncbi:M15 family metallopeptidase [Pseudonocardia sp. CA-107938]|uniref:M15 family metallopeptidase n=1 Tax=Pseudonocardia sp. CA-107938 TaxID=3240021 RepID=UPI003D901463
MNQRTRAHTGPSSLLAMAVVIAAIIGAVGYRSVPTTFASADVRAPEAGEALGTADGAVPVGVTVFDDELPAVVNLDPDLLAALRRAATRAAREGVTLSVNSGWRSRAYQAQLLREAVEKYGSEEEAARWVATPDTSPHVSGHAVDIGRPAAAAWLAEHGAAYGLCRIYANEPWHFELRPDAVEHGCPPLYPDPTHDPRMR